VRSLHPAVTPFFAENQSTVEGLSSNILKSLYRAAGLICVMHRRGEVSLPNGARIIRGSVWVEQEIAIAAFMQHVLERPIPIFFYREAGVWVEGIRSVLLLNPRVEFTDRSQVLEDLKTALQSMRFVPFSPYDLEPVITYRPERGISDGSRPVYTLICDVKNVGNELITDFQLRVRFPRKFLPTGTVWMAEDKRFSTDAHVCFVADTEGRAPSGLYPGDGLQNPLTFDYFVDNNLFLDPRAMSSEILIELFSGSMTPKKYSLPFRDYHQF
jgi:hypothetical protein